MVDAVFQGAIAALRPTILAYRPALDRLREIVACAAVAGAVHRAQPAAADGSAQL
jgi:hypothetical protein